MARPARRPGGERYGRARGGPKKKFGATSDHWFAECSRAPRAPPRGRGYTAEQLDGFAHHPGRAARHQWRAGGAMSARTGCLWDGPKNTQYRRSSVSLSVPEENRVKNWKEGVAGRLSPPVAPSRFCRFLGIFCGAPGPPRSARWPPAFAGSVWYSSERCLRARCRRRH